MVNCDEVMKSLQDLIKQNLVAINDDDDGNNNNNNYYYYYNTLRLLLRCASSVPRPTSVPM